MRDISLPQSIALVSSGFATLATIDFTSETRASNQLKIAPLLAIPDCITQLRFPAAFAGAFKKRCAWTYSCTSTKVADLYSYIDTPTASPPATSA